MFSNIWLSEMFSFLFPSLRSPLDLWIEYIDQIFREITDLLQNDDYEQRVTLFEARIKYTYILYFIALIGIVICFGNLMRLLLFFELGMLGVGMHFIYASHYFIDPVGQIAAIAVFVVAGVESAIGLSLFLLFYRVRGRLDFGGIQTMKG